MDLQKAAIQQHEQFGGKIEISCKVPLNSPRDLSIFYTPGVARVCREIAEKKSDKFTWQKNAIAIVTDGTAVLGLGNIGPHAAMPVMEGKAAIFKKFANVDAVPICLATQDPDEICKIVESLEPSFGGVNLEDIAAPNCFQIEKRLAGKLRIPVFHDDQHGTAIATLAGVENALKVVGKNLANCKIVFSGAGAAGIATAKLLLAAGAKNVILCDSRGAIFPGRENLNGEKEKVAVANLNLEKGSLQSVLANADIFIGLSKGNLLQQQDIQKMAKNPIVFAMANPDPEIPEKQALAGGAAVFAAGRSDVQNQVNNALVFPGIFKGILQKGGERKFSQKIFLAAARALASLVQDPTRERILPKVFDRNVAESIARAVVAC